MLERKTLLSIVGLKWSLFGIKERPDLLVSKKIGKKPCKAICRAFSMVVMFEILLGNSIYFWNIIKNNRNFGGLFFGYDLIFFNKNTCKCT